MSNSRNIADSAPVINFLDGATSNIQDQINNINPAPTFTATASGALANGDTVIVNANGTVSKPATNNTMVWHDAYLATNSNGGFQSSTYIGSNKVCTVYKDTSVSNYGKAVIGTISNSVITWGTPVTFESSAIERPQISYSSTSGVVGIIYKHSGNGNLRGLVGTPSGDTITFGSKTVSIDPINNQFYNIDYDPDQNKFLIVGLNGSSGASQGFYATIGSTLTYGTMAFVKGAGDHAYQFEMAYNTTENHHQIIYRDDSTNSGYSKIITYNSGNLSIGAEAIFATGAVYVNKITYDSSANRMIILCYDASQMTAIASSVSGSTITFGTAIQVDATGYSQIGITYDPVSNTTITFMGSKATKLTLSGLTLTKGSTLTYSTNFSIWDSFYLPDTSQIFVLEQLVASPHNMYGQVFTPFGTTLTAENYIGISNAAYADGAAATVQISGSVDDAQNSLTAGQTYFVQADGSLSLSEGVPSVSAGTAVSATKLIVKG